MLVLAKVQRFHSDDSGHFLIAGCKYLAGPLAAGRLVAEPINKYSEPPRTALLHSLGGTRAGTVVERPSGGRRLRSGAADETKHQAQTRC